MKSIELLDQIIEQAEVDDQNQRAEAIRNNKGSQAVGENWMVFHLKTLKKLLLEERDV